MTRSRGEAVRGYLRTTKASDLMWTIVDGDDPVWGEDEFIRDVLAAIERFDRESGERAAAEDHGV